jgi:general secretion pathway protein A
VYLQFFNLREPPFNLTPDPRFLFLSPQHEEALTHLLYGIHERRGFIEITGEVGTGKTILCRALLDRLDSTVSTALIFNAYLTELELLQAIVSDFGLTCTETTRKSYIDVLNQYLLQEFTAGRNAVVLIDEAQNLEPRVLEQLRMLSNLETERGKLVQIILVGQPELRDRLATPQMRQLDQRIAVRFHIHGLSRTETQQYIMHRLSVAGAANAVTFTRRAMSMIYRHCAGIPRRLNLLCDRILITAYVRGTHRCTARLVRQSLQDLGGSWQLAPQRHLRWRPMLIGAALAGLVGFGALRVFSRSPLSTAMQDRVRPLIPDQVLALTQGLPSPPPLPQPTIPPPTAVSSPPAASPSQPQVPDTDLALVRTLWRLKTQTEALLPPAQGKLPESWEQVLTPTAEAAGLAVMPMQAILPQLTYLSRPCFIEVTPQPTTPQPELWVLLQGFADHVLIYREPEGLIPVSLQTLRHIWHGKLYLTLEQDIYQTPLLRQDMRGAKVVALQRLLKNLGYLTDTPSGWFDAPTLQAVKSFQRDNLLAVDGRVGQQTLMMLFHFGGQRSSTASEADSAPPTREVGEEQRDTADWPAQHHTAAAAAQPLLSPPHYSVQVGSFRAREQAEVLRRHLTHKGYPARIRASIVPGQGTWYRVRVGHFANRETADQTAQRLATHENLSVLIAAAPPEGDT